MKRSTISILFVALMYSSCSLDSFLYNQEKIDHYELSAAVIPESNRRMVSFESEGNTLYGFYVWRTDTLDRGLTVLYCHGNKKNIEEYWNRVELFYQMGLRCLIFDYRGFGMSEGEPTASGLYADGDAALHYVQDSLDVDSTQLVLYGFSLGNVISIDLAAGSLTPHCLIAEAPFASAEALLQNSTLLDIPGSLVIDDDLNNAERIREIRTRLLLIHGVADDFIPWESHGRVVYENAPQPKELELVPGANHTDIPWIMGVENYQNRILNFLVPARG
ncbi:MAG: alpha/beta hydrolase [Calditrichota bacterium]